MVKLGDLRVRQNLSKNNTLKELKSTNMNSTVHLHGQHVPAGGHEVRLPDLGHF